MAEGHGRGAAAEQGAVPEEEGDQAAVQLEDAVDDVGAAVGGEQGEGEEQQSDGGGGEGPEVRQRPPGGAQRRKGVVAGRGIRRR